VALEMPGFGFSRPGREYRFTLTEQVGVLSGLLDALDVKRAHFAFRCVNAFVAAALAKRSPERVERLTLGQMPSVDELRRWAARIDLKVAGVRVLATPGVGQALMAAAPSFIAAKWFRGVSGPGADDLPVGHLRPFASCYEARHLPGNCATRRCTHVRGSRTLLRPRGSRPRCVGPSRVVALRRSGCVDVLRRSACRRCRPSCLRA
jgi:pimeloyl-ACP methyl ester carboxylesterase